MWLCRLLCVKSMEAALATAIGGVAVGREWTHRGPPQFQPFGSLSCLGPGTALILVFSKKERKTAGGPGECEGRVWPG